MDFWIFINFVVGAIVFVFVVSFLIAFMRRGEKEQKNSTDVVVIKENDIVKSQMTRLKKYLHKELDIKISAKTGILIDKIVKLQKDESQSFENITYLVDFCRKIEGDKKVVISALKILAHAKVLRSDLSLYDNSLAFGSVYRNRVVNHIAKLCEKAGGFEDIAERNISEHIFKWRARLAC